MSTQWVTFYSFKGGVGRTMALLNAAACLAEQERRILLIDFDLEAPGISSFYISEPVANRKGIVEYVCHYLQTGKPDFIEPYVHDCSTNETHHLTDGKIWLIPSGKEDQTYNERRSSIDWKGLYDYHSGADFIENFKADIEQTYKPDYVFIDSRTGLTEVGGVCTTHLPDLVVLLFGLNRQNVEGVNAVSRAIRKARPDVPFLRVATPVPCTDPDRVEKRLHEVEEIFGAPIDHTIHYDSAVALGEFTFYSYDGIHPSPLGQEYSGLATKIKSFARGGIEYYLREINKTLDEKAFDRAEMLLDAMEHEHAERYMTWRLKAKLAEALGEAQRVQEYKIKAALLNCGLINNDSIELAQALFDQERYEEVVKFCDGVTALFVDHGKDPTLLEELDFYAGLAHMALGEYAAALKAFAYAKESFWEAEAKRRIDGSITEVQKWDMELDFSKAVLDDVKLGKSQGEAMCGSELIGQLQQAYIAFACCGDRSKAMDALKEIDVFIRSLDGDQRVFSVSNVRKMPVKELEHLNTLMKESLLKGELWDRMKLPNSKN